MRRWWFPALLLIAAVLLGTANVALDAHRVHTYQCMFRSASVTGPPSGCDAGR